MNTKPLLTLDDVTRIAAAARPKPQPTAGR